MRIPHKRIYLLAVFFILLKTVYAESKDKVYIRNIKIIRKNVFTEINAKPEFLYKIANKLHVVTKRNIIESDLLFSEGDEYDRELLSESERRLRKLPFLGEAEITATQVSNDSIDIVVKTQDQWSTLTSAIIEGGGGRTTFGAALEEFNLLGYGKKVYTEIKHEPEGIGYTFQLEDPQLMSSRWTTGGTVSTNPFYEFYSLHLIHPFYSPDTKWAGGLSFSDVGETIRLFESGNETSRLYYNGKNFQAYGAFAAGERYSKKRLQLTYTFIQNEFSEIENLTTRLIPENESLHKITTSIRLEKLSFAETRRIDNFLITEDITLGNVTQISAARTGIPFPSSVNRFEFSLSRVHAHQLSTRQFLFFGGGFQTKIDKDTITSFYLRYYNKMLPSQTLAMNLKVDYASKLEVSQQYLLGGDTGLRGFPARAFSGARSLILNIENRIFTNINILTVALGGVVFLDVGNVWEESETIRLDDLNTSVGFGVRLGYTKSPSSRVGRIDLGFPLNGNGYEISIGIGQQFSLN